MIPLPTSFFRDGFRCTVLKRQGRVVLVSVPPGEHYEVAIIQQVQAKSIRGVPYPAHEAMPSTSQWGERGWSFMRLDLAEARFAEEVQRQEAKKPKRKAA